MFNIELPAGTRRVVRISASSKAELIRGLRTVRNADLSFGEATEDPITHTWSAVSGLQKDTNDEARSENRNRRGRNAPRAHERNEKHGVSAAGGEPQGSGGSRAAAARRQDRGAG